MPSNYYPNHDVGKRGPEIHKFSKAMRTSSVLAAAMHKDCKVHINDPSFTMIKSNVAPGYYDAQPIKQNTELGFFPKSKRMEFLEINYEPGPGSYNIKDNNVSKGFVIGTNVKDDDEIGGNDQRNMGPGK